MNPQDDIPDRQIWSRAADGGLRPAEFGTFTTPLIRKTDSVGAVGTMLAARLLQTMRSKKFPVIRVEQPHSAFADIPPEADEYLSFSAGYGAVWDARALRQLVRRADRSMVPEQDRRQDGDIVVDIFRPDLRYPARSDREFDLLTDRHLNAVRSAFRRTSTLIVALGGSEICEAIGDGTVIGAQQALQTRVDPERYAFRTLSVAETIADLNDAIDGLRGLNPGMAIILMISPEPPEAVAAPAHVAAAGAYGKAVLRVAMEEVAWRPGVSYFPALEISATLGNSAFGADGQSLSPKAITFVGAALIEACEGGSFAMTAPERPQPAEVEVETEVAAETAAPIEAEVETTISGFSEPDLTPEERRAARAAARAAEVAARVAARMAAAGTPLPPAPPPPPLPAKRAIATVVDAYTNTVPGRERGAKAAQRQAKRTEAKESLPSTATSSPVEKKDPSRAREPRAESAEAKQRRERLARRTAREARRADRQKSSDAPATTPTDEPATPRRARGQRKKADGADNSRQKKPVLAASAGEIAPTNRRRSGKQSAKASADDPAVAAPSKRRRPKKAVESAKE